MKYWVYKESRILGPFDKEGVSGLPGLDAGTLVCTGDPAGAAWVPAGEMSDLAGVAARYEGPAYDELPSNASLLDQLQIDSAGLIGDDEFPGSLSQEMFQDAGFKKTFSDVLSERVSDEELRKSRDTIADLTDKLAAMYRHVSELEAAQTDLARRLAAKDAAFGAGADAPAPEAPAAGLPAKTFLSPAPPPLAGGPPPVAGTPETAVPSTEWPEAKAPGAFPSFGGPAPFAPAAGAPPLPPAIAAPPAPAETGLPAIPSFASAGAPPAPAVPPVPDEPVAPAEAPRGFGKPKSFKVVPVVKSFKVLGAADAVPADANPVAEFKFEQPATEAAAVPSPPPPPPAPIPEPIAPVALAPIMPAPAPAPIPVMAPAPTPAPAPVTNPFTLPARPEPAAPVAAIPTPAPPPNTLSRSQPVPDLTAGDLGATAQSAPPETMARSGAAAPAAAGDSGVAARFAKPEPAPPTGEIKKPPRNNKPFLIGGAVLVTLLAILGVIFMRQPKEDLKQMATLDDGKAPIGLPADDGAAAPPPIVKPKMAQAPEPAPAPAPAPGPSAEHVAAINAVKDFPLDGGRGTVGRWLQYSYTASPNAGAEEWNASTTGEGTVLVEYRLVPGASGGTGALYLFEADANGLVVGKNLEARQMLAGAAPPEAPKAKPKAVKKTGTKRAPKKRRPVVEEPKEVPLLPLPDSGELRPPAEDDGSFGSDTINSGL